MSKHDLSIEVDGKKLQLMGTNGRGAICKGCYFRDLDVSKCPRGKIDIVLCVSSKKEGDVRNLVWKEIKS